MVVAFSSVAYSASHGMILDYIKHTWKLLTRSNRDLATAPTDPKSVPLADGKWPIYVARGGDIAAVERELSLEMQPANLQKIELRSLPMHPAEITAHGLLYLPRPYVVPGGRFNEMYGWDSFFIQMVFNSGQYTQIQ
jgi:alpha,alpha-trehalase